MGLGIGPREVEEPRDDPLETIDLAHEPPDRLLVQPDSALPELGRRADARQRVADLVRDAREQLPQGRQPLAPPQLDLEPARSAACRRTVRARPTVKASDRPMPLSARPAEAL